MIFGYTILFASIGYLLGSILFAQILSLTIAKKNIRELGSHNPGATNLTRNTNKTLGGAATLLDATKGYLAILICAFIADAVKNDMLHHLIYISGLFAVIGHCFPIVYVCSLFKHKFNNSLAKKHLGGKGVATFGGITFAFSP
jgi:glycerol-3-phosphate acyltransferase PlsY